MPDLVDRLAHEVASRIRKLGFNEPNRRMVGTLLEMAYLGTLRREEGQFVKESLTFANPKQPDVDPPFLRRAAYPAFTKFASPEILTVQTLVKLARAIDRWSGSIAVYATRPDEVVAWGVIDLGIVVSQDGYVRLIMTVRNSLVLWDNLKLLGHGNFSRQAVLQAKARRRFRGRNRRPVELGYTEMPKTIDRLMKAVASQRKEKAGSQSATKLRSARLPSRSRRKK